LLQHHKNQHIQDDEQVIDDGRKMAIAVVVADGHQHGISLFMKVSNN
jgi:hypothetical protein